MGWRKVLGCVSIPQDLHHPTLHSHSCVAPFSPVAALHCCTCLMGLCKHTGGNCDCRNHHLATYTLKQSHFASLANNQCGGSKTVLPQRQTPVACIKYLQHVSAVNLHGTNSMPRLLLPCNIKTFTAKRLLVYSNLQAPAHHTVGCDPPTPKHPLSLLPLQEFPNAPMQVGVPSLLNTHLEPYWPQPGVYARSTHTRDTVAQQEKQALGSSQ